MNLEQIKDEIRKLNSWDRIGLYRWINEEIAGRPGIGADRSLQIRKEIERMCRSADLKTHFLERRKRESLEHDESPKKYRRSLTLIASCFCESRSRNRAIKKNAQHRQRPIHNAGLFDAREPVSIAAKIIDQLQRAKLRLRFRSLATTSAQPAQLKSMTEWRIRLTRPFDQRGPLTAKVCALIAIDTSQVDRQNSKLRQRLCISPIFM